MSNISYNPHFKYLFDPWYPSPEWDGPNLGFRQNFHIQFDERVLAANDGAFQPAVNHDVVDPCPANHVDNHDNEEEGPEPKSTTPLIDVYSFTFDDLTAFAIKTIPLSQESIAFNELLDAFPQITPLQADKLPGTGSPNAPLEIDSPPISSPESMDIDKDGEWADIVRESKVVATQMKTLCKFLGYFEAIASMPSHCRTNGCNYRMIARRKLYHDVMLEMDRSLAAVDSVHMTVY
ncbi:hypothetical protein MJO29_017007 [Puccinia striiformis f. sp. tritici]|nr:hypothetical protein MJO29_017007 [Puccinia striiformis f. sp. tritici]